ncbi:MAG: autotransporter-associated beta strand repeat-containing protein [Thermoguttaceae bacterium]
MMGGRVSAFRLRVVALSLVMSILSAANVGAAAPTLYFDAEGGTKKWDSTTADWSNTGVAGTFDQAWLDNANATFRGTGGTVNVGQVGVGSMTFATDGYTLNGGTITAGGTITTTGTATINSVIAGSDITMAGTGTLLLNGANTLTGTATISQGTVRLGDQYAFQSSTVSCKGATLSFGTLTSASFGGLAGWSGTSLSLANDAGQPVALTVGGNNQSTSMNVAISGPGSLTKVGSGTLALGGSSNTFTGVTKVMGGTLALSNGLALLGSTLDYDNYGGTIAFQNSSSNGLGGLEGNQNFAIPGFASRYVVALAVGSNDESTTYGGALSGAGTLAKIGKGTWTLTGANVHTGNTAIGSGIVRISNPDALQYSTVCSGVVIVMLPTGEVRYTDGRLVFGSVTSATLGGLIGNMNIDLTNEAGSPVSLRIGNNNASTTYSGILSGSGSLTKIGSGTLSLTQTTVYSGTTMIDDGTLQVCVSPTCAGSSKVFVATNGTTFGATLVGVVACNAFYTGFGSTATGGNTLRSTADLIGGANVYTGSTEYVSMQWRERAAADLAASVVSDVFKLSGMTDSGSQTDVFTLKMSYSPSQLRGGADAELGLANAGLIEMVSFNTTTNLWENAVAENIGTNDIRFMGVGATPDGILGHYGIDPATDTVWAVLNHNSQFAVAAVPEPSTVALLAAGLLAVCFYAWRKRP